jgi:hypothetical protein
LGGGKRKRGETASPPFVFMNEFLRIHGLKVYTHR